MKTALGFIKNNSRLVWPYDLSLLRSLMFGFLALVLFWELKTNFWDRSLAQQQRVSSTYLSLFSERNAMIEFDRHLGDRYIFPKVKSPFGFVDMAQSERFTKGEFEALILASVPETLRYKLSYYLPFIVETAQKYQVDPFWILAVMWTESHFEHLSLSPKMAVGLMQLVPETGHFITQKVLKKGVTYKDAKHFIKEPYVNIELGTIYLKSLLERFNFNYRLATVAYNQGPSRVQVRLNKGRSVGGKNDYLNKVQGFYTKITTQYLLALNQENSVLSKSYVVSERPGLHMDNVAVMIPVNFKKSKQLSLNKSSPFTTLVY